LPHEPFHYAENFVTSKEATTKFCLFTPKLIHHSYIPFEPGGSTYSIVTSSVNCLMLGLFELHRKFIYMPLASEAVLFEPVLVLLRQDVMFWLGFQSGAGFSSLLHASTGFSLACCYTFSL